jgi:hypothetical protein
MSLETAKQMCDWFAVLFQLAIFAAIGGIAFTQSFADELGEAFRRWRDDLVTTQYRSDEEAAAHRQGKMDELMALLNAKGNYAKKFSEALKLMRAAIGEGQVAPYRYIWFATKGMALNFPGGLYGLLGFLFLVGQLYALSGKIILDHLPKNCLWN